MIAALLLASTSGTQAPTPKEIFAQSDRCGFVFNIDASPAGDGLFLSKDGGTLLMERRPNELAKRRCMATWAIEHGLKVHYVPMAQ